MSDIDQRLSRHLPERALLVLVMGNAASGKTTLSHEILKQVAMVYLDNNFLADAMFPNTRNDPEYIRLRPGLYSILYRVTEENLAVGNSVLLDVPHVTHMQSAQWREFLHGMVTRTRARLFVIKCRCSEETLRTRIRQRAAQRDQWKLAHWEEFLEQEPLDVPVEFPHIVIETERDLATNADIAVRYLLDDH